MVSVGTCLKILKVSISSIGWWFGTMECYDFPIIWLTDWWFGTRILWLSHHIGNEKSSQLTNSLHHFLAKNHQPDIWFHLPLGQLISMKQWDTWSMSVAAVVRAQVIAPLTECLPRALKAATRKGQRRNGCVWKCCVPHQKPNGFADHYPVMKNG